MKRVSNPKGTARTVAGTYLTLLAACVLVGSPAMADAGTNFGGDFDPGQPSEQMFDDHFDKFAELPSAPEPDGNVVDLTEIDPPFEDEPEDDGRVTRSLGSGVASYYGRRFHGRRTANGERFDMHAMTAAHKSLPFGTKVRVTNPRNGKSVTVRINDRGPYIRGRTIDLSRAAAGKLGIIQRGHGKVELDIVS